MSFVDHVRELVNHVQSINVNALFQPPSQPKPKLDELKLADLVALAKSLHIPHSGTKPIVRQRIELALKN
jgi:hypothetical protein